jgi:hypothetical protein
MPSSNFKISGSLWIARKSLKSASGAVWHWCDQFLFTFRRLPRTSELHSALLFGPRIHMVSTCGGGSSRRASPASRGHWGRSRAVISRETMAVQIDPYSQTMLSLATCFGILWRSTRWPILEAPREARRWLLFRGHRASPFAWCCDARSWMERNCRASNSGPRGGDRIPADLFVLVETPTARPGVVPIATTRSPGGFVRPRAARSSVPFILGIP